MSLYSVKYFSGLKLMILKFAVKRKIMSIRSFRIVRYIFLRIRHFVTEM